MKHLLLAFFLVFNFLCAQETSRFQEEVLALGQKYDTLWNPSKETVLFTGSSSIRFWRDLPDLFPDHQIVNTGFGGSHTSDLLFYLDELILRYHPKQVFIYEGDNDINASRKPRDIIADYKTLIGKIQMGNADTQIVLIAAKPSLVRIHLKRQYKKLNRKLKRLSRRNDHLAYADVWNIMFDGQKLREDIFIEDGLHMNQKGYQLWYNLIKTYIN